MLKDTRDIYRPFEYPIFEELHRKLMSSFWHPYEVQLGDDTVDFNQKLTPDEKVIITRLLRNFVQSEIHIGCFWGDFVSDWFKKPEIQNVARYISGTETIHAAGYDLLNTTLGLSDYDKLKDDKKLYARIAMLINKRAKTNDNILRQIFLYSVMGEGVSLFSSFLTLFAFTKKNLMKGVGQIVSWSSIEEALHSDVGCLLFNTLKTEYNLITPEITEELIDIAKEVVEMEHNLIDRVFDGVSTDIISTTDIKNYINYTANKQLKKVNIDFEFTVDKDLLKNTEFFDIVIKGASVLDFFAFKETNYSKGIIMFDDSIWEKE